MDQGTLKISPCEKWVTTTTMFINLGGNQFAQVAPITLPAVVGKGVVLVFAVTGTGASHLGCMVDSRGGQ